MDEVVPPQQPRSNWAKIAADNASKPLKHLPRPPPVVIKTKTKKDGNGNAPVTSSSSSATPLAPPPIKKATDCEVCKKSEADNTPKFCELCSQKGRDKIQDTHCMNCCGFCPQCDRRGHQLYNDDGSYQCFKMIVCGICGEQGHNTDFCRRDWCSVCRTDGLGDNFVGHATERCYKRHTCTTCNEVGHMENRCPTLACKNCGNSRHTTEQCEQDVRCDICNQLGHSASRCRRCHQCGFALIKNKPHRCRRDDQGNCKECGGYGIGKCSCYDYLSYTPRY